MTLDEINKVVFGGKLSLVGLSRMQSNEVLPLLLDVPVEDTETIRERIKEWRKTFVGKYVSKYPNYYTLIPKLEDLFGKRPEWSDFTKYNIDAVIDMFQDCAKSSVKTYMAMIRSVLNDAKDEVELPYQNFAERLSVKGTPSVNVFLTMKEIKKLSEYKPENEKEQIVLAQFLIGCYTGARHSDVVRMTTDNISNGYLTYVSQKTRTQTTVEAKPILLNLLPLAGKHVYVDCVFNDTIRGICRKVGIKEKMKLFRRGKDEVGEKWQFVASHTARRSFATNLSEMNVPIIQIAKRMGHKDVKTTFGYIVGGLSKLNGDATAFFG